MPFRRPVSGSLFGLLALIAPLVALAAEPQWLDVPYVHQSEEGCGAASVAMVMQYWMRTAPRLDPSAADGDRIYKLLASRTGIPGEVLKQYLEQHDFSAFVFGGELADLRQHLEKGRPVIVAVALKGPRAPLHYAVAVGATDRVVLLNDPARGKLIREDMARFLRAWKVTGNWALLAVPRPAE